MESELPKTRPRRAPRMVAGWVREEQAQVNAAISAQSPFAAAGWKSPAPTAPGKIAGWDKMSFEQRRAAQWNKASR